MTRTAAQLGVVAVLAGVLTGLQPQTAWLTGWIALSFALVTGVYLSDRPAAFGKGRMYWPLSGLLLFPFLVLTWMAWAVGRRRSPPATRITAHLWLGSWPLGLPDGVSRVVDLTAEFPPPPSARRVEYLALPTLDKTAPDAARMRALIAECVADPKPTLVHCAMGHGRSATFVAAWLVACGLATDVEAAEALIRRARPNIGLTAEQRTAAIEATRG